MAEQVCSPESFHEAASRLQEGLNFLPRRRNPPPARRGPSAWSLRPFVPWLGVHSGSWGPQCRGKLRHHLPRNSRSSSTLLVSAAAALAWCLGEGTSHSLSAGHRAGEKVTWLEGWEELGRPHCRNSATKASFRVSSTEHTPGSADVPAASVSTRRQPVLTPTRRGRVGTKALQGRPTVSMKTAHIQSLRPSKCILKSLSYRCIRTCSGARTRRFTPALSVTAKGWTRAHCPRARERLTKHETGGRLGNRPDKEGV